MAGVPWRELGQRWPDPPCPPPTRLAGISTLPALAPVAPLPAQNSAKGLTPSPAVLPSAFPHAGPTPRRYVPANPAHHVLLPAVQEASFAPTVRRDHGILKTYFP